MNRFLRIYDLGACRGCMQQTYWGTRMHHINEPQFAIIRLVILYGVVSSEAKGRLPLTTWTEGRRMTHRRATEKKGTNYIVSLYMQFARDKTAEDLFFILFIYPSETT